VRLSTLLLLFACGGSDDGSLRVDLRTDFVPGVELAEVVTVAGAARETHAVGGGSYEAGVRVATFDPMTRGTSTIALTLRANDGTTLASRTARVEVDGDVGVTVTITRACRDVSCAPGSTCVDGRCLDPACLDGDQLACEPDSCDSACAAPADCATASCVSGLCLRRPVDDSCPAGTYCDAEQGCLSRPGVDAGPPTTDAGAVDAGSDAGTDAGTDAGSDASADAGSDAGPDAGPPRCAPRDGDTVALFTFDDTFADEASGAVVANVEGLGFAPGPNGCGAALSFATSGAPYGRLDDDALWDLAEGAVSLWFLLDEEGGDRQWLFSRDHGGLDPPGQLMIGLNSTRRVFARIQGDDGVGVRCSDALAPDEWHHVGVNFGPAGFELWVDGEVVDVDDDLVFAWPEETRVEPCAAESTSSLAGSEGRLPWYLGVNNGFSAADTTDFLRGFMNGGRIDHFRISRVRRDFTTFR